MATTEAWRIAGWEKRIFSISRGRMFSPPEKLDAFSLFFGGGGGGWGTSDDDIFDATRDREVSIFIHGSFVPG
jgi:hypothetical protein